jgi:hypothetical protein
VAKLTLSVDDHVITNAKLYAKRRGLSISEMVEAYLATVSDPPSPARVAPPILRSVRGILKHADIGEYREHLATKYR